MSNETSQMAENKLVLLLLVARLGIPVTNSEICQFALEKNLMDYFSVQQYLSELHEDKLMEITKEHGSSRYSLSQSGEETLSYFINHISDITKHEVTNYVNENSKRIKAEYAVMANYFLELNNEYMVKCGICDSDGSTLMDFSILVATKEQARLICQNWRTNYSSLYSKIISTLINENNSDEPYKPRELSEDKKPSLSQEPE